jgi:hypothetical protein
MLDRSLGLAALTLALFGCSAASNQTDDDGASADALSTKTCAGTACNALSVSDALVRGKIATVGNELYWLGASGTTDTNGEPVDELRHCAVPACSSVSAYPLVLSNGTAVAARGLRTANGDVFFVGHKPGQPNDSFFLSDGQSLHEIGSPFDPQHDSFDVDAHGLVTYTRDRRTDGWARSTLRYCPFSGNVLSPTCATLSDASLNYVTNIALSTTRVGVALGAGVRSFARADLTGRVDEAIWSSDGSTGLASMGDLFLGVNTVISVRSGAAAHDTAVSRARPAIGVTVDGMSTAMTSTATRLYIATVGEGDVWSTTRSGVVARLTSAGGTKTIATEQDAYGVAVAGSKVYWLDRTSPDDVEDPVGVIRLAAK